MTFLDRVRVGWQAFKTRRKLNRQFRRREDPFSYSREPYELQRFAAMDDALGPQRLGEVLECGCAEGHFTERLARRADRLTALDISPIALARARARVPSARFLEADLLTWPGPESPVDTLVVSEVLYYLDRPGVAPEFAALFPRAAGWLRPGGRLLLTHAFAGEKEFQHRRSFRERFEAAGLGLVRERILSGQRGGVRCLLSVLERVS